jgi:hypothetical protein
LDLEEVGGMDIKDKLTTWYIRNILIPGQEVIDKPGFVITKFTGENRKKFLRDLILPELLFVEIEKQIVDKYKEEGKQALYSAGKKFGYMYANLSNFPTITTTPRKQFEKFGNGLILYAGCIYTSKISSDIDFSLKKFSFTAKDFAICRYDGIGKIFTEGGIAGMCSYLNDDISVEATQIRCQGRGDKECEVISAPEKYLLDKHLNYFKERDLTVSDFDNVYESINKIMPTQFARNSLRQLIDSGVFKYSKGLLTFKDERFINTDAHLLYILENETSKLKGGEETLFKASFNYGKEFVHKVSDSNYSKFLSDFMPALGWGDLYVSKDGARSYKVFSNYFPWTKFSSKSRYTVFRGLMSGILSSFENKDILFKKVNQGTSSGFLSIQLRN